MIHAALNVGEVVELIGLGAGLGILGLIGALTKGPGRQPIPIPVEKERASRPRGEGDR
jgi:hypothetical protein